MGDKNITYKMSVRLFKEDKLFGPGIARLLTYVEEYKSLNQAAAHMNMAYSKAWKIIKEAEKQLGYELITRRIGGSGGGGAVLTDEGRSLLKRYEAFVREAQERVDEVFNKYFSS